MAQPILEWKRDGTNHILYRNKRKTDAWVMEVPPGSKNFIGNYKKIISVCPTLSTLKKAIEFSYR